MSENINQAIIEIREMVSEVYAFMKEMKRDYDKVCGAIEIDRPTLERLLCVSESTLYRWRMARTPPYHFHSDHSTYYLYDEVYVALKRGSLKAKSFNRIDAIQRMKMYKEGIIRGCLSQDTTDPGML